MNPLLTTALCSIVATLLLCNAQAGLEAVGAVKKSEVLRNAIVQCKDSATLNRNNPFGYQLVQQSPECKNVINPYNVAFPDAPVPNAPTVANGGGNKTQQGKPQAQG